MFSVIQSQFEITSAKHPLQTQSLALHILFPKGKQQTQIHKSILLRAYKVVMGGFCKCWLLGRSSNMVCWIIRLQHRIAGRRKLAFDHSSGVNASSETQAEAAALVCASLTALQSVSAARQRSFKWKLSFKFLPLLLLTQDSFLREKKKSYSSISSFIPFAFFLLCPLLSLMFVRMINGRIWDAEQRLSKDLSCSTTPH